MQMEKQITPSLSTLQGKPWFNKAFDKILNGSIGPHAAVLPLRISFASSCWKFTFIAQNHLLSVMFSDKLYFARSLIKQYLTGNLTSR